MYQKPVNQKVAKFYCDGFVYQENHFVFSNRLVIGEEEASFFVGWNGVVKNEFFNHGQTFYRISIPEVNSEVVIHGHRQLSVGDTVFIGLQNEQDLYTF